VRHVPARAGDIARALADEPDRPATAAGWLRDVMLRNLGDDIDLTPAPSREAHLYVLGSGVPSVLLEMGFLSNRQDEAELKRPAHRRVIAAAVRDAVDDYFARMRHSPGKQT
jgi:N-acetylmuramoyl-L-alanine amidase